MSVGDLQGNVCVFAVWGNKPYLSTKPLTCTADLSMSFYFLVRIEMVGLYGKFEIPPKDAEGGRTKTTLLLTRVG